MSKSTPLPWPVLGGDASTDEVLPVPPDPDELVRLAAVALPLSRWLLTPADADALHRLAEADVLHTWPLEPTDTDAEAALRDLAGPHDPSAVAADHHRLFVGPGRMAAPPYESVHTSVEGLLFEPETLDVRAWYRHYGLTAPRQGREPDDHVGLELEFLATLAGWAVDALDRDDVRSAAVYGHGTREFTAAHVTPWVPGFCTLVRTHADTAFHRGVAGATAALVEALPVLLRPAESA